jgi:hypothetical protein
MSYTDNFVRTITPVNPQPGDPKIVVSDPTFNATADDRLNVMFDGGISCFVMNYGTGAPLFLAFEFKEGVTLDALDAAQRLKRQFEADADFRRELTEYALSAGTAFHEVELAAVIWRDPDDEPTAA